MIIYECVFHAIISPISSMADRDDMMELVMDYEERNDYEGLTQWLLDQFIEGLEEDKINYLHSSNIQHTLYYVLNCLPLDNLERITDSSLIAFEKYSCFTDALKTIYESISKEIGPVVTPCSAYTFNQDFLSVFDKFHTREAYINYMNT